MVRYAVIASVLACAVRAQDAEPAVDEPRPSRLAEQMTVEEALATASALSADGEHARAAEVIGAALSAAEPGPEVDRARLMEARAWIDAQRWEEAAGALRSVDVSSDDERMRASARFLFGQTLYREVMAEIDAEREAGETPGSEVLLERGRRMARVAAVFRSVLEVDPGDREAARNVERARRLVSQFEQQAQEQAEREEQQRRLREALEQLAHEQQERAEQTAASEDEQTDELGEQQQQTSERTEEAREQGRQAGANEEAQAAMDEARRQQEEAERALEEGDREAAEAAQRRAAEALREAAEQMGEQGEQGRPEQGEGADGEQGEGEPNPAGEEQEGEPRDETAEALLERERRQRESRDQRRSTEVRPVIVERDW